MRLYSTAAVVVSDAIPGMYEICAVVVCRSTAGTPTSTIVRQQRTIPSPKNGYKNKTYR